MLEIVCDHACITSAVQSRRQYGHMEKKTLENAYRLDTVNAKSIWNVKNGKD